MPGRPGGISSSSRSFRTAVPLLILLLILPAGCSERASTSETPVQQEEDVEAVAADSVEVLDDERSIERRIEDQAIATEVRLALVSANELSRFDFDPVVVNGRVLLRGEVNTQDQRSRAESVAKEIKGVRAVTNEITALEQPIVASADTADTTTSDQLATADKQAQGQDTGQDQEGQRGQAASEGQSTDQTDQAAGQGQSQPSEPQRQEETYHTVKSGESLWTISRQHGVTIDQIKRLNDLRSNNLRPGQRLRVK